MVDLNDLKLPHFPQSAQSGFIVVNKRARDKLTSDGHSDFTNKTGL